MLVDSKSMNKTMQKKYIIFGAGNNGLEVFRHLNPEDVAFFCDNNDNKVGQKLEGIEIISFDRLCEICHDYIVIVSVKDKFFVRRQLEKSNIEYYIEYQDDFSKDNDTPNDHPQSVMKSDSWMNNLINQYVDKFDKINPLNDFYEFKKLVVDLKKELDGKYAFYESAYNESMLYGHGKALMDYAGIEIDYANFPMVSHSLFYAGRHQDYHSAAIFAGNYDKNIHNSRFPYIPVFAVGPYIQYAEPVYTRETILNDKEKNGKTAIIFCSHGAEQTTVEYNEKKILNQILEVHSKIYSSIIVCAYWCDTDMDFYNILSRNGIKVVSAGFRYDTKFIQRLRTILELGDDIYCYGFTSAVGYALCLKKNLYVINCNEKFLSNNMPQYIPVVRLHDTDEYIELTQLLYDKMKGTRDLLTELEIQKLDMHFGLNISKTADEIRMMYEICCDIWDNCGHLERNYPIGVYKTYQQYQKDYDFEKLNILSQSLGKGFWNI